MLRNLSITAVLICVGWASANAQRIHTHIDLPDSLFVGDPFRLVVCAITSPGAAVTPPSPDEDFGNVVVNTWNNDRVPLGSSDSLTFVYDVAVYVPEPCTLPALSFIVVSENDTDTLRTDPFVAPLHSVIPAGTDSADIHDLKPLQSAGTPSWLWLWALLVVVALSVGAWAILRHLSKRSDRNTGPPLPPPYEEALESLRVLEQRGLIGQGKVQEHVFCLSDILKRYAGRRYGVHMQEFTTEEALEWLRKSPLDRPVRNGAEWFFAESDPVKFARMLPDNATLKRFDREVRAFLEHTHVEAETEPAEDVSSINREDADGV